MLFRWFVDVLIPRAISCVNALSWAQDGDLLLSGGDDTTCVSLIFLLIPMSNLHRLRLLVYASGDSTSPILNRSTRLSAMR